MDMCMYVIHMLYNHGGRMVYTRYACEMHMRLESCVHVVFVSCTCDVRVMHGCRTRDTQMMYMTGCMIDVCVVYK